MLPVKTRLVGILPCSSNQALVSKNCLLVSLFFLVAFLTKYKVWSELSCSLQAQMDGSEFVVSAVVGFTVVAATAALHYFYPEALPAAAEVARKKTQSNTADIKAALHRAHGRMPSVDIRGITWPSNEQLPPSTAERAGTQANQTKAPPRPAPRRVNRSRTTSPSSSPPVTSPNSSSIPSWVPGWSSSSQPTSPKAATASEGEPSQGLARAASVLLSNALGRPSGMNTTQPMSTNLANTASMTLSMKYFIPLSLSRDIHLPREIFIIFTEYLPRAGESVGSCPCRVAFF